MKNVIYSIPKTVESKISSLITSDGEFLRNLEEFNTTSIPLVNVNGNWKIIPTLKSKRYSYLHHREAAKYFFENLNHVLEMFPEVPKTEYIIRYSGKYSKMIIDAIIKKPFTLKDVKPFEKDEKTEVFYSKNTTYENETFMPRIRLINSFDCSSKIIFGLYRSICSNGMGFGEMIKSTLKFFHINAQIKETFQIETLNFFNEIFEENLIETIFSRFNETEIENDEFCNFVTKNLGKRSVKIANNIFSNEMKNSILNQWIAYNILTYIITHQIKDVMKGQYVMDKYIKTYIS